MEARLADFPQDGVATIGQHRGRRVPVSSDVIQTDVAKTAFFPLATMRYEGGRHTGGHVPNHKGDLDALIVGTGNQEAASASWQSHEVGILVVAIPTTTSDETIAKLKASGFTESEPAQLATAAVAAVALGTAVVTA